jgi:1-acyl-sn-glycerol-3-phosphate acyltransferase
LLLHLFFGISEIETIREDRCIVIANHNSHIDSFALFLLFPLLKIHKIKTVAARDHFSAGLKGWIARYVLNTLLIDRHTLKRTQSPLHRVEAALRKGYSLIIYPEGSRGNPGEIGHFKSGIGELAEYFPDIPIYPVHLEGAEKILPRHAMLPVPFNISMKVLPKVYGKDMLRRFGPHSRKKIAGFFEEQIKLAA